MKRKALAENALPGLAAVSFRPLHFGGTSNVSHFALSIEAFLLRIKEKHAETSSMNGLHIGSRLSFKGDLCTVRFIGKVSSKKGLWIGVEWDDQTRGKHSGTFAGNAYFSCLYLGSIQVQIMVITLYR